MMNNWFLPLIALLLLTSSCSTLSPQSPDSKGEADKASKPCSKGRVLSKCEEGWMWPLPANQRRVQFFSSDAGRVSLPAHTGAHAMAVADGKVIFSNQKIEDFQDEAIIIAHDDGYYSVYGNLQSRFVEKGNKVYRGQAIGRIKKEKGSAALVFEIRHKGDVISFKSIFSQFQKIE